MIRPMTIEDIEKVLDIFNDAIINTTAAYHVEPQTLEEKRQWFLAKQKVNDPMFVYEENGEVIGFVTYSQFRSYEGYKYSMEHSVYVDKNHHGKGIGKILLQKIIDEAKIRGVKTLIAVIDSENIGSIKMHEKFGFYFAGRLKNVGYKFDKWLDIVYYQLDIE